MSYKIFSYYEKGKWGRNISRWFNGDSSRSNGYKIDCGIEHGAGKVFHSFRHAFAKNLLSKVGEHVDLSRIGALMGHEEMLSANASKITLIYTQGYNLEVLNKAVNELHYDIDLSHINFKIFKNKHKNQNNKNISTGKAK